MMKKSRKPNTYKKCNFFPTNCNTVCQNGPIFILEFTSTDSTDNQDNTDNNSDRLTIKADNKC